MRLHLPKALLAAVLAACLAWPAGAEGEDTSTPTTVTVTKQSDLTNGNNQLTTAVSSLGTGDLLIFKAPGKIHLTNGDATMPMDIQFMQDFLIQNGFGDKTYTFSGALISEAGITATMTPDVPNTYNFSGNLENFKGSLVFNNNITANFQNVGTVGAKSISLAGTTTITGTFSSSGNLTNTGTLTNSGSLTIGGSYTGGTITQDSSASLVLSNGSIVNLDSIAATNNLTNTETTGVQAYSKSWALVSGGSLTDNEAIYKLGGNELTGGSMSSGTFTSATSYNCYNIASGTSKSYSEVTDAIGTETVDLINVLGTLTGISGNTNNYSITGNGRVTITGELGYDSDGTNSFLNSFVGVVEVADGGNLKLGSTIDRLSNASKIIVTTGGIINIWTGTDGRNDAKVGTTAALELAGGTLGTSGGSLTYSGEIIVTASSYMGVTGVTLTLTNTVKAQNGVITTNGTVKHTGGFDLSGNGNVYTGTLLIESGSFESASNMWGTSKEQHKTTIQMKEGTSFKKGDFTFTGKSNTDSIITFGKTGIFGVGDAHTVDNTAVTYAGSADATDATILGMNLGNGSTLTVTSGKLKVSGTNTLARMDINGGETTISGSTEVTGTVSVVNSSQVILTSGANLTNSGFTFTGQSGATSSTITFGATGAFAVSDAHTVANTSVTYAGSADATDATVLGMNLADGSTLTVTSGKLKVSGTNKLARINLNGGETTLTGSTEVIGTTYSGNVDGVVAADDDLVLTISANGTLKHDGFEYTGTKLSGLSQGLSMWNADGLGETIYNVSVSEGTITQTSKDTGGKTINADLSDVRLVNGTNMKTTFGVDADLSGADIGGTLSINEATTTTIKNTFTDSTGATGSTIATLTGKGTLKTTGGTTEVTNATGFSGTLAATGGNIELQSAAALALSEVVVSGGSSITVVDTVSDVLSISASKVSIGKGAAGSLVGNLSIQNGGTITLDASDGATTETGGTKGLSLSALTTTLADEGSTSTTGSLTLGSGLTLTLLNLGKLTTGDSLTLFSGVTSAVYGDAATELTADGIEAKNVFSNLTEGDFKLSFDETNHIVALVTQRDVPEPTTATLSLLALMGLAARRRRRKA